ANSESAPFAAPTVIEIARQTSSDDNIKLSVNYPEAREYKITPDSAPGKIYEGSITISAVLSGASKEKPIELVLKCQPCTDNYCLQPIEEVLKVTQED